MPRDRLDAVGIDATGHCGRRVLMPRDRLDAVGAEC